MVLLRRLCHQDIVLSPTPNNDPTIIVTKEQIKHHRNNFLNSGKGKAAKVDYSQKIQVDSRSSSQHPDTPSKPPQHPLSTLTLAPRASTIGSLATFPQVHDEVIAMAFELHISGA